MLSQFKLELWSHRSQPTWPRGKKVSAEACTIDQQTHLAVQLLSGARLRSAVLIDVRAAGIVAAGERHAGVVLQEGTFVRCPSTIVKC